MINYPHLLSRISAPLMIEPNKLNVIMRALGPKLLSGVMAARPDGPATEQRGYSVANGIATIPIIGTLVNRSSGMDAYSGMTSYQSLSASLSQALADPSVSAIMLEIDSPGGEVSGVHDLADQIFAARKKMPIWALCNDMAASAAYELASAAEKIVVSRTSMVGSIGVLYPHVDETASDAMEGLKYDFIYAGKQKLDSSSHFTMSEEARARIQGMVDSMYDLFVATVARNRGLDEQLIRNTEAGIYQGKAAIKAKLADNIGTMGGTYAALSKRVRESSNQQSGMARNKETHMSLWDQIQSKLSQPDSNPPAGQSEAEEYVMAMAGNRAYRVEPGVSITSVSGAIPGAIMSLSQPDPEIARFKAELAEANEQLRAQKELVQQAQAQSNRSAAASALRAAVEHVDGVNGQGGIVGKKITSAARPAAVALFANAYAQSYGSTARFFVSEAPATEKLLDVMPNNVGYALDGSGSTNMAGLLDTVLGAAVPKGILDDSTSVTVLEEPQGNSRLAPVNGANGYVARTYGHLKEQK
jgi:signal peptide peptidase SppA